MKDYRYQSWEALSKMVGFIIRVF